MTTPRTMHALRIRRFGGPEVVEIAEIDLPRPGDNELLVKVEAASLNPVDWKIRSGKYPLVGQDNLPYVLGRDFSGTVVHGSATEPALTEGTLVHGLLGIERGSFAQYVVARLDEVARVPASLDRVAAASVPLAGLTAWQGLFDHGGLQSGQRVLIHAGAGGVGHFAVQFAKARGATVIATASTDDIAFVQSLGADEVIDYKKERFEDRVHAVDLVYDLIGGETQERSWAVLKHGGALVSTVAEPSKERAQAHGVRATRYTAASNARQLGEIDALIVAGLVKPLVARTYALANFKDALHGLEEGHGSGKLVFDLASPVTGIAVD